MQTVKLGDLESLQKIRDSLIRDGLSETRERQRLEQERWDSFKKTISKMAEAVDGQDLEDLVSSVRRMKNLLRRPSVKRDLAQMEAEDQGKDKPEGSCKCSQCGKTIDGYNECIKGALCVDCAMKNRETPPGEAEKEKDKKSAEKGVAFPPEMVSPQMQAGPEGQPVTNQPGEPEEDEEEEEPVVGKANKDKAKLRKNGFAKMKQEDDEISVSLRRKGLRHRSYEKWQL